MLADPVFLSITMNDFFPERDTLGQHDDRPAERGRAT